MAVNKIFRTDRTHCPQPEWALVEIKYFGQTRHDVVRPQIGWSIKYFGQSKHNVPNPNRLRLKMKCYAPTYDCRSWNLEFSKTVATVSLLWECITPDVTHPVTMADVEIWNFQRHFPKCLCYGNVLRRNVTHPVMMAEVEIWNFFKDIFQSVFVTTMCYAEMLRQCVTPKCYANVLRENVTHPVTPVTSMCYAKMLHTLLRQPLSQSWQGSGILLIWLLFKK